VRSMDPARTWNLDRCAFGNKNRTDHTKQEYFQGNEHAGFIEEL
jgi:hypothetical protein